jgi:hypothetical protein
MIGSHLPGFMYFPSQTSPLLSVLKQLLLLTLSKIFIKKLATVVIGVQRKNEEAEQVAH